MAVSDQVHGSTPKFVDVVIEPVNDESPIIADTSSTQVFIEQRGPIRLVDSSVTITDDDNCLNHTLIREVRVRLDNPLSSEDQFIVNGSVLPGYVDIFSCDQQVDGMNCYTDYLRTLEYNNTNTEPGSFRIPRIFIIEV